MGKIDSRFDDHIFQMGLVETTNQLGTVSHLRFNNPVLWPVAVTPLGRWTQDPMMAPSSFGASRLAMNAPWTLESSRKKILGKRLTPNKNLGGLQGSKWEKYDDVSTFE